jgi:hypothetical protein
MAIQGKREIVGWWRDGRCLALGTGRLIELQH